MAQNARTQETQQDKASEKCEEGSAEKIRELPAPASARLAWEHAGEHVDYVACASHLDVREDTGELRGSMFSVSYVACDGEGHADPARPVTFCYNGGPGCASVPINFGGVGPRRVATDGTNHLVSPPVVEDNPHTLLRESDLVFLDALGTGWSELAPSVEGSKAYGVDADADSFARAISSWLEREGRWESRVYLLGESYGTIRNAVLMRVLGERNIQVAGVVMVSALFDWVQTLPGEDLYYIGMVPTYAAAAQFFGRAGEGHTPDEWFDLASSFAEGDYAAGLLRGDRLPEEWKRDLAERLGKLIGVNAGWIAERHLRIELDDFRRELLRDEGLVTGRLDMRFTSAAPSPAQRSTLFFLPEDAADDAVEGAWSSAFRSFMHTTLGYRGPAAYLANNYAKVGKGWDWSHEAPWFDEKTPIPNVAQDIAVAMRRNPNMRVMIMGGRYDAATTWWNVEHDISCLFLPDELRDRITWHRYGCGHMAYVDETTLEAMGHDLEAFYGQC